MDSNESLKDIQRPSWLTNEFVTEVLRKGESDPEIVVEDIDFKIPLGIGENYTSVIQKATATYVDSKGHKEKKTLIMKVVPQNSIMQYFLRESGLFRTEFKTYSKLFPAMASLTDAPLVTAKFYPSEHEGVLILEDMSSRGFKMADRKKRLDLAHSFLVLKNLARFHGLSYAVVERDPGIVGDFPESLYSNRMKEINSKHIPKTFRSLASVVESWDGFEKFAEKIRHRAEGVLEEISEILLPKKDAFNVLNHGDCWVNNMLFRYNKDNQEPEEVCFLDLQIVRYGSPALDLQYFFASSLADGIREKYEDILLEAYHKELSDTLKSVAINPVTYTLEDLRHDFQEKAIFGFDMGCLIISVVVADSGDSFDIQSLTEELLEEDAVNPMDKMFLGIKFRDVFQKFLLYYESKFGV